MADEPLTQTEEEMFAKTGELAQADEGATNSIPVYKVIGDDKIPVSKEIGKMWRHRKTTGQKRLEHYSEAWKEAIRYYNHDHTTGSDQATSKGSRKRGDETENLVFSNVSTLMPTLYAQNPIMEFTNEAKGEEEEQEDKFASIMERVVNNICRRKHAPGVNLKSKVRKATLFALLCNIGWIKIDWTLKAHSSEGALLELEKISKQYQTAKDEKEIFELEGRLRALEDVFSLAVPTGPSLRTIHPGRIIVDPDTEDTALSDCMWIMEYDYLPTNYIKQRYTEEKDGEDRLIYKPTHVMKVSQEDVLEDNMFDSALNEIEGNRSFSDFGFKSDEEFKSAQYTKVWYAWDRLMQRVYMFHDGDWTYPIWVWNKPLSISRFFPYFCLSFHEGTENLYAKGEVTYYLDQQDAINEINAQQASTRKRLRTKVIYDSNLMKGSDIDGLLNSDSKYAIGVAIPEGGKLDDVFQQITPVDVKFREVFDKTDKYKAIDRIAAINEVMRGGELRTNTTEDAVKALQDATQSRLSEKISQIEDFVQDIVYTLAELCIQNLSKDDVQQLVGTQGAGEWPEAMSLDEFNKTYSLNIVAGSSEKPTSKAKQKQALEMGQVLGQFVNSSPAVLLVLLKVFEKAFSEVALTEDDWKLLRESIQMAMQAQAPQPEASAEPDPAAVEAERKKKEDNPSLGDMDLKKLFATVMKILPPEMKTGLETAIKSGLSPMDALGTLAKKTVKTSNGQGETTNAT